MPATAKEYVMPVPAQDEGDYVEFNLRGVNPGVEIPLLQMGWVDGSSKRKPRYYEILALHAKAQASAELGNRVLNVGMYYGDLSQYIYNMGNWATGNIADTIAGSIFMGKTGLIMPSDGLTPSASGIGGLITIHDRLIMRGGDYFYFWVTDPLTGDTLDIMVRAKYLNYLEGINNAG